MTQAPSPSPSPGAAPTGPSFWQKSAEAVDHWTRKALSVAGYHVPRAFQWNLHSVPITDAETRELNAAGITDGVLQRYFAWRRSLLAVVMGPLAVSAILKTIDTVGDTEGSSNLGILLNWVYVGAQWAMPAAAFLAFQAWSRPTRSRRFVLLGWLIGFIVPFAITLVPFELLTSAGPMGAGERMGAGLLVGVIYSIALTPLVMSILPGMVRAAVRMKTLMPGSILPGWFLLTAAPLSLLIWLVPLTTLNAITSGLLLVVAMALFVGSSLWYVWHSKLFTRPCTATEVAQIGPVQKITSITSLAGAVILLVYMLTHTFAGRAILGFNADALMRPWSLDLYKFVFDYLARSLFMTAVFADVIIRACTRAHKEAVAFHSSAASAEHERAMDSLEKTMLSGR